MNLNSIVGILSVVLGALSLLVSFAIALRQYVFSVSDKWRGLTADQIGLIKTLIEFFKQLLQAPPALAFLAAGLILLGVGIWILATKPL